MFRHRDRPPVIPNIIAYPSFVARGSRIILVDGLIDGIRRISTHQSSWIEIYCKLRGSGAIFTIQSGSCDCYEHLGLDLDCV
jgi:hypothetical protein